MQEKLIDHVEEVLVVREG